MNKIVSADGFFLLSAGRSINTPFKVFLHSGSGCGEVTCTRVLRNLPGRRLVCAGEKNGEKIVVKFFLDQKRGEKHCTREEKGNFAIKEAGIHAPQLLLKGRLKTSGEPALVFREIDPGLDFTDAWQQAKNDDQRSGLLKSLASATAAMHEAGLVHNDAHPGNFMISNGLLYAVDGASVNIGRRGKPLSTARSLKNIAAFFAQFSPGSAHLLPDAFGEYVKRRAWPQNNELHDRLAKQVRIQRKKREKKYLKKIYRESSAYVCEKNLWRFLVCDRRSYTHNMAMFLAEPDSFIDGAKFLKDGNSSTVALVEVDNRLLVVKRYNMKNIWHALSRCPRPSRAWHCWKSAHRLMLMEIATPKPAAFLEKRWGPLRSRAYFITEYVRGIDARQWFNSANEDEPDTREIVRQFAGLLCRFHEARIVHGDFKATNFILSKEGLAVTDLDAMRSHRRATGRFRKKFKKDRRRLMKNWADLPAIDKMFREELAKLTF